MKTLIKHEKPKTFIINKPDQNMWIMQDFKPIDDRILDARGRITISQNWTRNVTQKIRSFKVYQNSEGDLLLRPEVSIPAREAWMYKNPKIRASIQKGIQEAKEGKGEIVDDIQTYIEKL